MDFTLFMSQDVTVKNDGSAKGNVKYLRYLSCRNIRDSDSLGNCV